MNQSQTKHSLILPATNNQGRLNPIFIGLSVAFILILAILLASHPKSALGTDQSVEQKDEIPPLVAAHLAAVRAELIALRQQIRNSEERVRYWQVLAENATRRLAISQNQIDAEPAEPVVRFAVQKSTQTSMEPLSWQYPTARRTPPPGFASMGAYCRSLPLALPCSEYELARQSVWER